jgi:glycosyltransferase involved in cell wall biosynthesis
MVQNHSNETNIFRMISILHPSRERAEKSYRVTHDWISKAVTPVELIVSIDDNDPQRGEYLRLYSQADPFTTRVISNNNRSAVDAINRAAEEAKGNIFIVVSDDTECCSDWSHKIMQAVSGREDYVLRVDDGIQRWIVTAPIIDRVYYNRFGYVYNPEYQHQFVDTEFTHVAQLLGKIIRRDDILFRHLHYSKGLTPKDNVYHRSDATLTQGCRTYLRRFKESFGLQGVDPWNLPKEAEGHLSWLRNSL